MRAIQVIDSKPQLVHRPLEAGRPGEVTVRIVSSSICGSDLHLINRGWAEGLVLGHEFAGYTPDGTAVAVEPMFGCGACHDCEAGYPAHCADGVSMIGVGLQGGMAEQVNVPASTLVPLPSGLPLEIACLVEPLAVAVHGVERARVRPADRVLVIGAGAIGLATAAVLQGLGMPFDMAARHPHQQAAAQALGARLEPGEGYDVVLDAVGAQASLDLAVERARPRGRIGMLGTFWDPVTLNVQLCSRELELIPAMTYRCRAPHRSFDRARDLLAANPGIADHMLSHRYPLEGVVEVFATAADRQSGAIKVCFSP